MLLRPTPALPLLPTCPDVDAAGPSGEWDDRYTQLVDPRLPQCSMLLVALLTAGAALFTCYL
jgi:hypothetical protein